MLRGSAAFSVRGNLQRTGLFLNRKPRRESDRRGERPCCRRGPVLHFTCHQGGLVFNNDKRVRSFQLGGMVARWP
jgi:hypothetical protein